MRRSPRAQAGFTLVELLVVTAILAFAMAAVYSIYQVTQRSALFAMAGEDAQTSVRSVLDRLANDLRMINTGRMSAGIDGAVIEASATRISFFGNFGNTSATAPTLTALADTGQTSIQVNATTGITSGGQLRLQDGFNGEDATVAGISGSTVNLTAALQDWYPAGTSVFVGAVDTVNWAWDAGSQTLCRAVNAACALPYDSTTLVANGITGVRFRYYNAARAEIVDVSTPAARDSIREVRVEVTALVRVGDQTVSRMMEVTARPRGF